MLPTRTLVALVALIGSISSALYPAQTQAAGDTCIEDGGSAECIGPVVGPYRYQVQLPGFKAFLAASEQQAIDALDAAWTVARHACNVEISGLPWQPVPTPAPGGQLVIGNLQQASVGNGTFWRVNWRFGLESGQLKIPLTTDTTFYNYTNPPCRYRQDYWAWSDRYRDLACPSEGWWDLTWRPNTVTTPTMAYCWRTNPQDIPKNFGGQCPLLANPIHGGTGNKYQAEADYTGAGSMPLNFTRHYNSRLLRLYAAPNLNLGHWSNLGPNWRSSYDRFIGFAGLETRFPTAYAYRPDGKIFYFKLVNGQFASDADIADRLARLTDSAGNTTGWQYTVAATDETETYDASGKLTAITNRARALPDAEL